MLEKGSSALERRLYNCKKFNPAGETQTNIAKDYGFTLVSLNTHLKYHQNPRQDAVIEERMNRNMTQEVKKYASVQDTILEKGLQGIEDGEIKLTANTIATVARDKMNQEERNKDRQVKVMEMIWAFSSGELNGDNTFSTPRDVIEG